ncbi:MAG: cytochrome P460 family protein [Spirochaetaceae bacterium]|nr:cytochrome P460 family protein [Spirochaetaceae bacterium]
MTKYILRLTIFILLLTSCSKEIQQTPLTSEEISGERLWERISRESHYSEYSFWPGHEGINPGQAPHGVNHRIYINKDLFNALPIESKSTPYGTIIVKENMNSDWEVLKITVMAKVNGFNPEGGNWFWAAYSPEGEVQAEGTPKGCISCHEGMKSNDFIIIRQLDSPLE